MIPRRDENVPAIVPRRVVRGTPPLANVVICVFMVLN